MPVTTVFADNDFYCRKRLFLPFLPFLPKRELFATWNLVPLWWARTGDWVGVGEEEGVANLEI